MLFSNVFWRLLCTNESKESCHFASLTTCIRAGTKEEATSLTSTVRITLFGVTGMLLLFSPATASVSSKHMVLLMFSRFITSTGAGLPF